MSCSCVVRTVCVARLPSRFSRRGRTLKLRRPGRTTTRKSAHIRTGSLGRFDRGHGEGASLQGPEAVPVLTARHEIDLRQYTRCVRVHGPDARDAVTNAACSPPPRRLNTTNRSRSPGQGTVLKAVIGRAYSTGQAVVACLEKLHDVEGAVLSGRLSALHR